LAIFPVRSEISAAQERVRTGSSTICLFIGRSYDEIQQRFGYSRIYLALEKRHRIRALVSVGNS
jgi:hypothetical protein